MILKWCGANAGTTEDSLTNEKWGNAFDIFTLTSKTTMSALLCMNMAANAGSISSAAFGSTADGKAVSVYTLTNDRGASVKFLSYGGIITQINVPDRWGRIGNVVLGLNTAAEYEAKSPYFGALVGRYANRIAATRSYGNETEVRLAKAGAVGKRLIWSNETEEGDVFDDDVLKALSSRDPIRDARWHHQRPFTFSMHPVKHAGRAIAASGGFCGWGALPPIPGQKIFDAAGGVVRQPAEDIGELGARIDLAELAGFDQRIDGGSTLAAAIGAGKSPIVPADGDAAQGAFGCIIRQANAAVIEEAGHGPPAFQAVMDGLGDGVFRGEPGAFLAQPGLQVLSERT